MFTVSTRRAARLALIAALLPLAASAQQQLALVATSVDVSEADGTARVHWGFNGGYSSTTEVRFTVATEVIGQATAGQDFVAIPPTVVVVPPGVDNGDIDIAIVDDDVAENHEAFRLRFSHFDGAQPWNGDSDGTLAVEVSIDDEDYWPTAPLTANDDHVFFVIDEWVGFVPGENDIDDRDQTLVDSTTTVTVPPQHGVLSQSSAGIGADAFSYMPEPGFAGEDRFEYRFCKPGGEECVEATVYLHGALRAPLQAPAGGRTAGFTVELDTLPEMADARFSASSLAHPRDVALATGVDATPHRPWDSRAGFDWETATIPAGAPGTTTEYRVRARSLEAPFDARVDVRIGVDTDGDGAPSADEQRCVDVSSDQWDQTDCEFTLFVGDEPVTYWVAAHSRNPVPTTADLLVWEARMDAVDTRLKLTGPALVEGDDPRVLAVTYIDPAAEGTLTGYVRVRDGDEVLGDFRMDLYGHEQLLLLPTDATPTPLTLDATSEEDHIDNSTFFEIPLGMASLAVTVQGDAPLRFALRHFVDDTPAESIVYGGGLVDESTYVDIPAGQARTITITSPLGGRWYPVIENTVDRKAHAQIRVALQGSGPILAAGSYYNPRRPGHGLLLYPAGDQWAGLWYTYDGDRRPTWYYLQAPEPGADGVWRAPVIRDTWHGDAAQHTQVGVLTIAPITSDAFFMSYVLDGRPGSELMSALGSDAACPRSAGVPVDISSHWFDPARAGNGYSIQTWADGYQFVAAFGYDRQGYPSFLAAERGDIGGDVAELALERLRGFCPTCDWIAPERTPAGTLRRTLVDGQLTEITLDVAYPELYPLSGTRAYTVTDRVQLLGGPGTTQGCD